MFKGQLNGYENTNIFFFYFTLVTVVVILDFLLESLFNVALFSLCVYLNVQLWRGSMFSLYLCALIHSHSQNICMLD